MNTLTLKAQRKKAKVEKQQQHVRDFYTRAFKGLPKPETPAQELLGIERYLANLERLKDEIERKYAEKPHFNNAMYWVTRELETAAYQLVRLRIEILHNERMGLS